MRIRSRQVRLTKPTISKVSGVDHPAHLEEGWAVLKSAAAGDEQALAVLSAADDIAAGFDEFVDALTKAEVVASLTDEQRAQAADLIEAVLAKAEWSAEEVDELPDSAFAYIEPGGTKDADGKTTPRSLRHFPYKDEDGNIDLPHLRNALARAPQSPFGPKAMPTLEAAAKKAGVGKPSVKKSIPAMRIASLEDAHDALTTPPGEEEGPMPTATEDLAKALERISALEADLAVAKAAAEATTKPAAEEEDPIAKATKEHPELGAFLKAQQDEMKRLAKSAEDAEKMAKAERDARIDADYIAKAKAMELPEPAKVAKALRQADEAGGELADFVKGLLIQRGELEHNAQILKAFGADGEKDDIDPLDELETLAKAYQQEHPEMSYAQAYTAVSDTPKGVELRKALKQDRKAS